MFKNWTSFFFATVVFSCTMTGCGEAENVIVTQDSQDTVVETVTEQNETIVAGTIEQTVETDTENENSSTETTVSSESSSGNAFTFENFASIKFSYCSGAGAWSEDFQIERDGYLHGLMADSDAGDSGEGYPDGTRYSSVYTGHVSDLVQISDTVYEIKLADISYLNTPGTDELADNVKYIYTTSSFFDESDTLTVYLPGTQISDIPEEVYSWLGMLNESETELTMVAIADLEKGIGAYSYERMEPLQEAQLEYSSYKTSYDYYNDLASEALTTAEMLQAANKMYVISDELMNKIWTVVKYSVDEERFQTILSEQREWDASREARAKELSELDSGSMGPVDENLELASMTMERCEELIAYLN